MQLACAAVTWGKFGSPTHAWPQHSLLPAAATACCLLLLPVAAQQCTELSELQSLAVVWLHATLKPPSAANYTAPEAVAAGKAAITALALARILTSKPANKASLWLLSC